MPTPLHLSTAHSHAVKARQFADKGKDNAAVSYLAASLAELITYLIVKDEREWQEKLKRGDR